MISVFSLAANFFSCTENALHSSSHLSMPFWVLCCSFQIQKMILPFLQASTRPDSDSREQLVIATSDSSVVKGRNSADGTELSSKPDSPTGVTTDGGVAIPDSVVAIPDSGVAIPDSGVAIPDSGVAIPDRTVPTPSTRQPTTSADTGSAKVRTLED